MNTSGSSIERSILIFAIWAVLGFLGLGVFLEGIKTDIWLVSASGVSIIVVAFVAHIIVNGVFNAGFSAGETSLGLGAYGLLGLVFVLSATGSTMTATDYYSGLTLFGVLALGFLAYLFTRHGLRGAFSRFHVRPKDKREEGL
ncbi:hypothetical protein C0075_23490 [Rhizobium sp. KAs_5_22]|uniref:hypothetical protein n=1 Tax=Ciceribacter selenitireducens TaxID=448181 RepID=UPI0004921DAD|nr:hypothetical protein [Ciceribacter selenitireducens]PPJ48428.1 hypothetical protein C0075_23490 [Rhizobium sp. KAs_5_22]